ncbi:hypothetical protein ACFT7S_02190 [Streptomyces sp. NPDC057136]|uniref:hypothetical protein n=1 Tax=Streptomyces sp. NPDC057136 TaxID=3346029 RepID=UPI00362C7647
MSEVEAATEPEPDLEPQWLIAANVVRWRRYGKGGQELRPGTKACRGGSKVYVYDSYDGFCDLGVIGRGRHTGAYITLVISPRHLHTFRAVLVRSPTVLRRLEDAPRVGFGDSHRAGELAVGLEQQAAEERLARWPGVPHPSPCRCHECLALSSA